MNKYDLKNLTICVDFDGTCVTHEYPDVGRDIGAQPVLRDLVAAGAKLILFTMRSGEPLEDAVRWFANHDIPLYGVNVNPSQKHWTQSPKAYAQLYIDDAGINCPLIVPKPVTAFADEVVERPYVDWEAVRSLLLSPESKEENAVVA